MSGGSMNYAYSEIEEFAPMLQDKELIDLAKDFAVLMHDCEWYHSSDIGQGSWRQSIDTFKEKWFKGNREDRLKRYAEQYGKELLKIIGEYDCCEKCKHRGKIVYEDIQYGQCKLEKHSHCLWHPKECCNDFERADTE